MTRRTTIHLSLLVGVAALTSSAAEPSTRPTRDILADERRVELPGFGLAFSAPEGWLRVRELHYSQLARFARIEENNLRGLLELDVVPSRGRSAEDLAATLAKERGGRVLASRSWAHGGSLVEIAFEQHPHLPAGFMAIMPMHHELAVLSMGAQSESEARTRAREVVSSMVLQNQRPAVEDLALRKREMPLYDSAVLVRLPEPFRPDKPAAPEQLFFGARDWPSGRDEASIQVQLLASPPASTPSDVVETLGERLAEKFKLSQPLGFEQVNNKPEAFISEEFSTEVDVLERIVLVRFDEERMAIMIFRTTAPEAERRNRYMKMVEDVAEAMRVSKPYDEARRAVSRPAAPR